MRVNGSTGTLEDKHIMGCSTGRLVPSLSPCRVCLLCALGDDLEGGEPMLHPTVIAGTFANLERVVHDLCRQIDELAHHLPGEEDRAYAELAKENLWKMFQNAHKRALARTGLAR